MTDQNTPPEHPGPTPEQRITAVYMAKVRGLDVEDIAMAMGLPVYDVAAAVAVLYRAAIDPAYVQRLVIADANRMVAERHGPAIIREPRKGPRKGRKVTAPIFEVSTLEEQQEPVEEKRRRALSKLRHRKPARAAAKASYSDKIRAARRQAWVTRRARKAEEAGS